jgi:PAS domain S-box-containing protein
MSEIVRDNVLQKLGISFEEYEKLLIQILDTAPDCIKPVGPEGEIISMNDAGMKIVEADDLEQVMGACVYTIIADEYRDLFKSTVVRAFQGAPSRETYQLIGLKGRRLWLEQRAVPFANASGKIVAMLGITTDVTEQRNAAEALGESEEQYRALVEDSSILMCQFLPNFEITFANSSYSTYYGDDKDSPVGSKFLSNARDLNHSELIQRAVPPSDDSSTQWHEYVVTLPSGETRWQRWAIRAIGHPSSGTHHYQAIGEDVTLQKGITRIFCN